MNIKEAYNSMNVSEAKFDAKKAEQTMKDFQKLYAQMKFVGVNDTIQKEMKQVYSRLGTAWFGSNELKNIGIAKELK